LIFDGCEATGPSFFPGPGGTWCFFHRAGAPEAHQPGRRENGRAGAVPVFPCARLAPVRALFTGSTTRHVLIGRQSSCPISPRTIRALRHDPRSGLAQALDKKSSGRPRTQKRRQPVKLAGPWGNPLAVCLDANAFDPAYPVRLDPPVLSTPAPGRRLRNFAPGRLDVSHTPAPNPFFQPPPPTLLRWSANDETRPADWPTCCFQGFRCPFGNSPRASARALATFAGPTSPTCSPCTFPRATYSAGNQGLRSTTAPEKALSVAIGKSGCARVIE